MAVRLFLGVWLAVVATAAATHAGTQATPPPKGFKVIGHVNPGGGYSADVVGERHYAYLSSRRGAQDCPAQGVRVYDLANPRHPRHIATFARLERVDVDREDDRQAGEDAWASTACSR